MVGSRGPVILAVFVLATLGVPLGAAAPEPGPPPASTADFRYALGSVAVGTIIGTCEASAVRFPAAQAGSMVFRATAATLDVVETWTNSTRIVAPGSPPVEKVLSSTRGVQSYPIGTSPVSISWGESGAASLAAAEGDETFRLSFVADQVNAGIPDALGPGRVEEGGDGLLAEEVEAANSGRSISFVDALLEVDGGLRVFLTEASITAEGFRYDLPSSDRQEEVSVSGVSLVKERRLHGVLRLEDAQMGAMDSVEAAFCRTTALHIQGSYLAHSASGTVRHDDGEASFEDAELSLAGNFWLHESSDPREHDPRPLVAALGQIEEAQVDYASAFATPAALSLPEAVGWIAAIAGAASAWKLSALLYARLRPETALRSPTRRDLFDAIQQEAGIDFEELVKRVPMDPRLLRYHLRVLVRAGHVTVVPWAGRFHYTVWKRHADELQRQVALEEDPVLSSLVALVGREVVPAGTVVRQLVEQWGLSRSGAWKAIDRAARIRLVEKQRSRREVSLRIPEFHTP